MIRTPAPLILAAALLLAPTPALAGTQWFYERNLIAEGEKVEVAASSERLTVVLKVPGQGAVKIPCLAKGVEAFWNTPESGRDETRSIAFSCSAAPCGKATVRPLLPWSSTLLEGPRPLFDRWDNVALKLVCGGVNYGIFTGSLEAKVGDVDPGTEPKDELDNNLTFKGGAEHPRLLAPNGDTVWFTGFYRLGGNNTGIGDEAGS
jgi:hypothetical protein